ncbi:MAG TPA: MBL fold metallo-hydrolase [Chroococcales cyanobacterium]
MGIMADPKKAVPENVSGNFFVDRTCINCDTCRQLARSTFKDQGDHSFVFSQPQNSDEQRAATRALICCPTGSIGTHDANSAREVVEDLPLAIEEEVYYCGFNSPKSYGGNSFFVQHRDGNWLIDSPKYLPHLVDRFTEMGGVRYIFLTHRDDVGDAHRYAEKFEAQRIIHRAELDAEPNSEVVIDGFEDFEFSPEFRIVAASGHTRGHIVLIYRNKFLFSGDHMSYDPEIDSLMSSRTHCWYSWAEQTRSIAKLADYEFQWVLAAHGDRIKRMPFEMKQMVKDLAERMELPEEEWNVVSPG